MGIWQDIHSALTQDEACVLVTLVGIKGSSPREAGARMVVRTENRFSGTIGGGRLEYDLIELSGHLLKEPTAGFTLRTFALGPDLGQCCGGSVQVGIEVLVKEQLEMVSHLAAKEQEGPFETIAELVDGKGVMRDVVESTLDSKISLCGNVLREEFGEHRHRLFLFGAGHVGKALVLALAPLPFTVFWIDSRKSQFPQYTPSNVKCIHLKEPEKATCELRPRDFVVIMTHDHGLDQRITDAALRRPEMAYVGLIGSKTKRNRIRKRLLQSGVTNGQLENLVCPIGVAPIESKVPAHIAVSVAAELLVVSEQISGKGRSIFELAERAQAV
ncbi:xanthine dehydrogenase accessory protein XdhC [Rhodobacteraceae bacterium RKSG542]|uniref:xanthine dehydrogenase accessory protein XdhC n=1 Tax=Pseudovibrio flavus TaxID=2529854 RepID=UPI0012BBB774|nr:xanthine dehydrogenase accessory protein XdhC [Pseudovibrio flavus]MTI17539.1 xanthine dehydrogenase accessory protein XdhC [Pseudovibrio flavus]